VGHASTTDTANRNLADCFGLIAVDEAHKLSSVTNKSVAMIRALNADKRLAITATPISNTPSNFVGMMSWIQPPSWNNHRPRFLAVRFGADRAVAELMMDEIFEAEYDNQTVSVLRCHADVVERLIFNKGLDLDDAEQGRRLGKVWEKIMIRQTHNSSIPFDGPTARSIGREIPAMKHDTVGLRFSTAEAAVHKQILSLHRQITISNKKNEIKVKVGPLRLYNGLETSLEFQYLEMKQTVRVPDSIWLAKCTCGLF